MYSDPIADLLTRIRNGLDAEHPTVNVPASSSKKRILSVLCDEGYISGVEDAEDADGKPSLKVYLKYQNSGAPVIQTIERLSTPGRRRYVGKDQIPFSRGGLGVIVLSTSQGMMSDQEARKRGVGGELICSVF